MPPVHRARTPAEAAQSVTGFNVAIAEPRDVAA